MEITTTTLDNLLIISLEGNLLGENSNGPILDLIKEQINAGQNKIGLDLSGVKYINSTGMGMFIAAQMRLQNAGGKLVLFNVSDNILKLFKLMKIDSTFTILPSQEETIKFLA